MRSIATGHVLQPEEIFMPTMTEIYHNHSFEYDELVSHEDYLGNLPKTLHSIFDFNQKSVIELGVGTGRLTKMVK